MILGDLVEYSPLANQPPFGHGLVIEIDAEDPRDPPDLAAVHWLDGGYPTWCKIKYLRVISEAEHEPG